MPLSYPLFVLLYILSIVGGVAGGLLLFVGWKRLSRDTIIASARKNIAYVIVLALLPLVTLVENILRNPDETTKEIVYTNWIFTFSGDAIRVLQDRLDYQLLADLSIVVYVWVFSFVLYFTPILLISLNDSATIRRYSVAMMINYAVLIPFYLFFPVTVTGLYADSGVTPLLYINTNWGRMVTSVDPLNNDFPSGHVSMVLTTLLVLVSCGWRRGAFTYFLIAAVAGLTFSVLYLGVHWPADVFAGVALAIFATIASKNVPLQEVVGRFMGRVSSMIAGDVPEENS